MARKIIPIIEEIKDAPAPLEAARALKDYPYPFFLDSSMDPGHLGRYSFLGSDPFLVFKSKGDRITIEENGREPETLKANPFITLKEILARYSVEPVKDIPFTSGAVGYFAYDLKRFIEKLPDRATDDLGIPDCIIGFYDCVLVYDNLKARVYIAGLDGDRLHDLKRKINNCCSRRLNVGYSNKDGNFQTRPYSSNFSKKAYIQAVLKAKEYIKCGDIYQVNLSQRFETEIDIPPFELYRYLRKASPAPFSAYLGFGDVSILSSSPERFLLKKGSRIETRPIKGTRPRGKDQKSDLAL
jgi:para-aminobenzoate synthetase component 1